MLKATKKTAPKSKAASKPKSAKKPAAEAKKAVEALSKSTAKPKAAPKPKSVANPKTPAKPKSDPGIIKQTTDAISQLASDILHDRIVPTIEQIKSLAESALSRDQTKGKRTKKK